MSDLEAAAAALNAPEALVQRSAEARASATGSSVDEVLAAWAGGGTAPAAAAPAAEEPPAADTTPDDAAEPAPAEPTPDEPPAPATPPPGQAPAAAPAAAAVATAPARAVSPPILEGRHERPFAVMFGAAAALALALVAGLLAPSIPEPGTGVRSSEIAFSEAAVQGRDVYRALGCEECHTQVVRPVVTDAGLGPVTLGDTNQEIGLRRHGPDLSNVGSRIGDSSDLGAIVLGAGGHPAYPALSDEELANLVAYLSSAPPTVDTGSDSGAASAPESQDDTEPEATEPGS